jgi:adenylate cyclase
VRLLAVKARDHRWRGPSPSRDNRASPVNAFIDGSPLDMIPAVSDPAVTSTFVFADLAGYTALTEAHGDERAARVAVAFCDELRGLLGEYGAEEVKAVGDALIVRVSDAGQALRLAARIVGDFGARDRALGVRVGMHTGTAVRLGDDWFGSAVNVASRIADLAHAGEVIVSAATRQAAASSALASQLRPRGRRSLKHVPEPVEVFALVTEGIDSRRELPVDPVCRIAVDPAASAETIVWRGVEYHFCSSACADAFRAAPTHYLRKSSSRALALVSDEARESAARRLARAYAKGRINASELEQRMEGTWSARTRADLAAVTHDLPRRRRAVPVWQVPIFPLVLLARAARARMRRLSHRRRGR